ncbi:restriction endonuclease subunit S [Promicromonospora citrea]|uniref:Type I restriction modification DNA specificity domain-containing protein n=1 Tax=Promicromonospora citrea TaxID=43677 RepID=A0A8H9GIF6_9MICO|nr:restriction endonuclease subunit S [Promicromonospora citrea]NNH54587.1 hypothetical protein [Promicromonospora citrea]GGM28979.1 hypothetical protein GCM10010102_25950 [Promicromonospora citrea]
MTGLPAGWRWLTPHEIAGEDKTRLVIGPFGSSLKTTDYTTEGVPLVFVRDIRTGNFRAPRAYVGPAKAEELRAHQAEPGDVLVTKMGEPPGDAAVFSGPVPAVITADCIRLRPIDEFDPYYISYALQSPAVREQVLGITSGVAQRKVSLARFRSGLQVPVPSLPEQRRIVEFLEDHLSRLDASDSYLSRASRRLARLTTSALMQMTHGLPDVQPMLLSDVAEVRLGRQRSPKNHSGDRMRPYLRAANVDWNKLRLNDVMKMNFTESEEATYHLEAGDILLTEASGSAAEVGKSVIYEGVPADVCFQNTLLRVRCHAANPRFIQKYLLADAMSGRFMPEARGVGINHLGRAKLAALTIELPDEPIQADAAARAEGLLTDLERTRQAIEGQRIRSASLRRSLFAAAFSGRLTGRPSDLEVAEEYSATVEHEAVSEIEHEEALLW